MVPVKSKKLYTTTSYSTFQKRKIAKTLVLALALLLLPTPAYADVVWPALFLETRLVAWWVILSGLLVEFLFLRLWFKLTLKKAIVADLAMNLVSTLMGLVFIPLMGFIWEIFPGILLYKLFNIGTFNPGTWMATFLLAVFINAGLETLVLAKCFEYEVGKKGFWMLCLANMASVAIAFISILVSPVRP